MSSNVPPSGPVPDPTPTPGVLPPAQPPPPGYPPQQPQVVYVQAPPQKKGRNPLVIILALIGLCVVGSCGGVALMGVLNSSGGGGGSGGSAASTANVGEQFTVGSWQITIESAKTAQELEWSEFGNKSTAKGKYVIVYATVENVTQKTDSVNSFDWKILDGAGTSYDTTDDFLASAGFARKEKRETFASDLPAKTPTKFVAVFDVAPSAQDLTLQIENRTKIALGNP